MKGEAAERIPFPGVLVSVPLAVGLGDQTPVAVQQVGLPTSCLRHAARRYKPTMAKAHLLADVGDAESPQADR